MTIIYNSNNIENIIQNYNYDAAQIVENYSREDLRNMYQTYLGIKWNKNFTKLKLIEKIINYYKQKQLNQENKNNTEIYDITK